MLDPDALGAYAVYFAAALLVASIHDQLFLLPSRLSTLDREPASRLGILSWSIPMGAAISSLGCCLVAFAGLAVVGQVSFDVLLGLAMTSVLFALLSPLQDHLRRLLHLANRSRTAALVSAVHLATAIVSIGSMHASAVRHEWIPLGSLVVANATSLLIGFALATGGSNRSAVSRPGLRSLLRSGRTLVLAESFTALAGFTVTVVVASLVSAEALGFAEAARVVAQPILVLGIGIGTVVTPRLMEAGAGRSVTSAMWTGMAFSGILAAAALLYLVSFGWSHPWNPLERLLPAAYVLPGLVALRIVAVLGRAVSDLPTLVLYGARENRSIVLVRAVSATVMLASVVALGAWLGAYSIPIVHILAACAAGVMGLLLAARATDTRVEIVGCETQPNARSD